MKKTIIILVVILAVIIGVVACGGSEGDAKKACEKMWELTMGEMAKDASQEEINAYVKECTAELKGESKQILVLLKPNHGKIWKNVNKLF